MPLSPIATRAAVTTLTPVDVTELADTLWHLSLTIPAGSVRKHACAIRVIAAQMDEVLASAFGDGAKQALPMQALMEELTGQAVNEADMRESTQLEKAYPDVRLAIGKIGLLYHQTISRGAGPVASSDVFVSASNASFSPRHVLSPVSSQASPTQSSASDVDRHVSSSRSPSGSSASVSATSPAPSPSPMPAMLPTPRRSPPRSPPKPAITPSASLVEAAEQSAPQVRSPIGVASPASGLSTMTASLKRCLLLLESDALHDVADAAACFISPQTDQVWSDPVIDMRDGQSYERAHLPMGVPMHHVRTNGAALKFLRTWRDNLNRAPTQFASQLEATVRRDKAHHPIYDPIIAYGTGAMYSAQALTNPAARGYAAATLASIASDETFCVNRLLVRMMRHFNIGVPDAALSNPARFWPHAATQNAPADAATLPLVTSALGHPHASEYGHHMQGLWELLATQNCVPEMLRYQPQLEAILVGHANVLFSSNSDDYHEAFNAGVNVNPLIDNIAVLLESVRGASLVAGLRIMRADCFDVLGNAPQTIADLEKAALAWPESLTLWGREESLRQLIMMREQLA